MACFQGWYLERHLFMNSNPIISQ